MLQLISAEWLKLTRRPLLWILLALFLGLLLLQTISYFVVVVVGEAFLRPEQYAEYQRRMMLPGLLGAVFGHINGLGGIFAIILAAAMMGSEYSWGTLRTQLARSPDRTAYLAAKLVTLLLLLLTGMLIALLAGVFFSWVLGLFGPGIGTLAPGDLLQVVLALVRAMYVLLPYVLLTLCLTIYGRSLLIGLAGGLIYLVVDLAFGALAIFAEIGGIWQAIYNLMIGQNINTLVLMNSRAFGLQPEVLAGTTEFPAPSPGQAIVVIALYSLVFLAGAWQFFVRRDVGGPQ